MQTKSPFARECATMRASNYIYKQTNEPHAHFRISLVSHNMVSAAAPSASAASKAKKAKTPASHPPFLKMIIEAITALKERGGSSRQAILKYIKSHYKIEDKIAEVNLRRVLVSAATSGKIIRVKGVGASGSFKLPPKGEKESDKPKKSTKPKTAKATKKPATPKKEKSAAKPKKTSAAKPKKSPTKKAEKKPPAAKKPKAAKPKKAATKKTTKKAAAPKK